MPIADNQRPLAVITGGTKGIGAALTREFASHGFDVATFARSESQLLELKNSVEKTFGTSLFFQVTDAGSKAQVDAFADFINRLNRKVEVLIHNAGYFLPGNISNEEQGTLSKMLAIHVESAYHLTQSLLPGMLNSGSGDIFTICSVASLKPYTHGGSYSIAKTALLGFTRNLREELKNKGIRVTAVLPGATYTESWAGSGYPEDRLMPVEDIAKAIWSCHTLTRRTVVEELILRPQLGDL
jgi:short-subunit dehydrogenase